MSLWAALRRRIAFWGEAISTGIRWAWGVLDGIARLVTVVVLLAAVALPSFLTHRPAWESLGVAGMLLLAIFAEGSYRVWRTADEQLVGDEDESQGEPVSDEHRKDLQAIAEHLLEGVKPTDIASFLADGDERVNLAIAFTEHFPKVSQRVIDWGRLIEAREAGRQVLRDWVAEQLSEAGVTGVASGVPGYIAREAEFPEPRFSVDEQTSEVRIGGSVTLAFSLAPASDRKEKVAALRELFHRVTAQPAHARISKARLEMKSIQIPLIEDLELVRDKTVIRGRCKLCA